MDAEHETPKQRWRPSFSLLALLLFVLLVGSCVGLWFRWSPWICEHVLLTRDSWAIHPAFSPDARYLALAGRDRVVCVWDVCSGRQVACLSGHRGEINGVRFTRDGLHLVTAAGKDNPRIWDVESGRVLVSMGQADWSNSPVFSHDERYVMAVNGFNYACVFDAKTGHKLQHLAGHQAEIQAVAASPTAYRFATSSYDRTARVWDLETGAELFCLQHGEDVRAVAFSPSGKYLATGDNTGHAYLWDANTGELLHELTAATNNLIVWQLVFAKDGREFATAGGDGTVMFWNTNSGEQRLCLHGHTGSAYYVGFSPDQRRIATTGRDRCLRIWDYDSGEVLAILQGHQDDVWCSIFASDGRRIASCSNDGTVRVWFRRRPEYWWGIAWLPEFWIALVSGTALLYLGCCSFSRQFQTLE